MRRILVDRCEDWKPRNQYVAVFPSTTLIPLAYRPYTGNTWIFLLLPPSIFGPVCAICSRNILSLIFQCWPVQYFWIKSIDGTCIGGQLSLYMATGSLSLVEDVTLLILPLIIAWRLTLTVRRIIQLTVLFSVSAL